MLLTNICLGLADTERQSEPEASADHHDQPRACGGQHLPGETATGDVLQEEGLLQEEARAR